MQVCTLVRPLDLTVTFRGPTGLQITGLVSGSLQACRCGVVKQSLGGTRERRHYDAGQLAAPDMARPSVSLEALGGGHGPVRPRGIRPDAWIAESCGPRHAMGT
jgi:hypothetical protein